MKHTLSRISAVIIAVFCFALSGSARGSVSSPILPGSPAQSMMLPSPPEATTPTQDAALTEATAQAQTTTPTEASSASADSLRSGSVIETQRDSVKIWFRQSKINLVPELHGNREALDSAVSRLQTITTNPLQYRLQSIQLIGAASPEGTIRFNRWLSKERSITLINYLNRYVSFPDSLMTVAHLGRDWQGLKNRVLADPAVPQRDKVLSLLDSKPEPLEELKKSRAYPYLYLTHFPELRAASLVLEYQYFPPLMSAALADEAKYLSNSKITPPYAPEKPLGHIWFDLRSNLLYDAALAPNIGFDIYLGNQLSAGFNWKYAWYRNDSRHIYWRDYGGDINVKYWFGKLSEQKPLQGHHIGAYAQMFTYDFEFGGKGVMGGLPGGTLLDKYSLIVAADYGYSIPLTERYNIDLCLGLGYMRGEYREYHPEDGCYVWDATRRQQYFGLTKVEISLVRVIDYRYFIKGGRKR